MDIGEVKFLNALNAIPHVGASTLRALKNHFGSFASAWKAGDDFNIGGVDQSARTAIATYKKTIDPDREIQKLSRGNIWTITDDEDAFPPLLKEIAYPPLILYGRGDKNMLAPAHPVAVVGTRRPTPYGLEATESIVEKLVSAGVSIISGLATGIDAKAHSAALTARGMTIAVLGCGVDQATIFPPENRGLAQRIADSGGAVISEYAPGTPAVKEHFPMRNRIIAGLAQGTLVVEAREQSGALITARLALEENREVFAIPGSIFSSTSTGTNKLIQQGAKAVRNAYDILEELGIDAEKAMREHTVQSLTREEAALLMFLAEPVGVDTIRMQSGLPIAVIMASLSLLELKGIVRNLGGDTFQKI